MGVTVARGWIGDASTEVIGRLHNELLFYVEPSAFPLPALRRVIKLAGDDYWYPDIRIWNVGYGTNPGIVTGYASRGYNVLGCRIAMVQSISGAPWKPGIHLFSVEWNNLPDAPTYNTIATAVVDSDLEIMNNGRLGHQVNLLKAILEPRSVLVGS